MAVALVGWGGLNVTLSRALISSPTCCLPKTLPLNNLICTKTVDCNVSIQSKLKLKQKKTCRYTPPPPTQVQS